MLLPVMREIRNFFEISNEHGNFEIKNGAIAVTGKYIVGQYVAITGSILNNGVKRVESVGDGVISFTIPRSEYPPWVRPVGTIGLHSIGDRVTHNGERWVSMVDNNSWEPGVVHSVWEQILDSTEEHTTTDEVFSGVVYSLRVPPDFVALCDEIAAFNERPGASSDITSESFGNYSYSRATDGQGRAATWQSHFRARLIPYRRMFTDINI